MRNTIIVSIILFVAVIVASILYFSDMGEEHKNATKALTYIPADALMVVTFKNNETTDNIFKDYEVFDAILGFQHKKDLDSWQQKVLRSSQLSPYLSESDIYISFHKITDTLRQLYTIPLAEPINTENIPKVLHSISAPYTVTPADTLQKNVYRISYQNKADSSLFVTYYMNAFFASASKEAIAQVLSNTNKKLSQEQIDYFLQHQNKNVPLSIYFAHDKVDSITRFFKRNNPGDFISQFLGMTGQSTWNINYKQDALMLTGESEIGQPNQNYIALFSNQSKTTQRLYNYFPANTAMYLEYSISDAEKFRADLTSYRSTIESEQKRIGNQISSLNKNNPGLMDTIAAGLGNEFAILELSNRNYVGMISLKDSTTFKTSLKEFSTSVTDSIYRFSHSNLLYLHFGDALKPFQRPFFTIIDDIVVFANYQSTLQDYVRSWNRKDLLIGTLGFKNFERMQGNEANITFFLHTKNANNTLENNLERNLSKNFRNTDEYGYQDFYSWSAQLSGNNGHFISSIYGIYKSSTTLGATADWTYSFDNRLITRPYIFEHSDTSQFILAQEQDHTVHAIHPNGTKMWSAVFGGRIVGDMIQLPDRSIVLVTDRSRLYRFDQEGKTLPGFSLGMPHEPSATPFIYDYQGASQIIVPAKNKLLAYDMEGNAVQNWNIPDIEGDLLEHIYQSEDMLVAASTYGRLYFFDYTGSKIKEIDIPGDIAFNSQLGRLKKGDKEYFVTTDTSGTFYAMSFDEDIQPYKMEDLTSDHEVFFQNIDESASTEMVVLHDNQLHVYNIGDSVQQFYSFNFTKKIDDAPLFFKESENLYRLGIAQRSSNLIYVFNDNGSVMNGFPVEGLPLFYYGKINYNSGNYLLCSRRDHKLYAYKH